MEINYVANVWAEDELLCAWCGSHMDGKIFCFVEALQPFWILVGQESAFRMLNMCFIRWNKWIMLNYKNWWTVAECNLKKKNVEGKKACNVYTLNCYEFWLLKPTARSWHPRQIIHWLSQWFAPNLSFPFVVGEQETEKWEKGNSQ